MHMYNPVRCTGDVPALSGRWLPLFRLPSQALGDERYRIWLAPYPTDAILVLSLRVERLLPRSILLEAV